MNYVSHEYGIVIEGCSYEDLKKVLPFDKENGCIKFGKKFVETHPWNPEYIFVSYGDANLVSATPFPKHKGQARAFQKRIGKIGKARWGIIVTER